MTLPEGWKKKCLEELGAIQTGVAKNDGLTGRLVEVPYLRVANVQDGHLDLAEIKTISIPEEKLSRYRLQFGDVLLTEGGDFDKLGRGTVWRAEIDPCVHQNHVFVVRTHPELHPEFLSMLSGSGYGKAYFQSCSKQSTNLASINSSQLRAFPVILPPLPEQKAITSTLATWDTAIEKMERLIAAKERRFLALVDRLITRPVRAGTWDEVLVGSFLDESRIQGSPGDRAKKLTVKLYGKGAVPKSEVRQGSESTQYYVRRAGQFIYSKLDFLNGAFAIIPPELDGYESTLDLPAFDVSDKVSADWLLYFFSRPEFYESQVELARGQRIARRINPSDLLSSKIPLPPLKEQRRIVGILDLAKSENQITSRQLDLLRRQKRGLMQKLLTGAWRTKET